METMAAANGGGREAARYDYDYDYDYGGGGKQMDLQKQQAAVGCGGHFFQMPLHYPRYSREDYEAMPEWQLNRLLSEYGLPVTGTIQQKRTFAMGAFLWGAGAGNNH